METAAYKHLRVELKKREALALYYRMTSFMRERDPAGFSAFMAFRESTRKDRALMGFVLGLMAERHPDTLAQLVPAPGESMAGPLVSKSDIGSEALTARHG